MVLTRCFWVFRQERYERLAPALVTKGRDLPAHPGHPQTPLDTVPREYVLVDLARPRMRNRLAPPLAPQAVRIFSNLASDLEPPYGIEP
jgi:hypothetical protein